MSRPREEINRELSEDYEFLWVRLKAGVGRTQ